MLAFLFLGFCIGIAGGVVGSLGFEIFMNRRYDNQLHETEFHDDRPRPNDPYPSGVDDHE